MKPAGISAPRNSNPRGRKPAGKNVEAYLLREAEIHRAVETTKSNKNQAFKAAWEANQLKKLSQNGKERKRQE